MKTTRKIFFSYFFDGKVRSQYLRLFEYNGSFRHVPMIRLKWMCSSSNLVLIIIACTSYSRVHGTLFRVQSNKQLNIHKHAIFIRYLFIFIVLFESPKPILASLTINIRKWSNKRWIKKHPSVWIRRET